MYKVGIIIPVFNQIKYTQKVINSLEVLTSGTGNENVSFEIVVCDDGSSDGTASWLKTEKPKVHLLHGDGSLWWSGGVNKGSKYALENLHCTHILWWNNDVKCAEDYFINLSQIILKSNDNQLIGSKIFDLQSKDEIWSMGGIFDPKTGNIDMYAKGEKDSEKWNTTIEADWFPGMGTVSPKALFDTIGYCDEKNFPQYFGDSDFTLRANYAGFKLITHPNLRIFNDTTNTSIKHDESFKQLFQSLKDIKSIYNISKDLKFYSMYASSLKAYTFLLKKYFKYIGGFFKWRFFSLIGKKRTS